MAYYLGFIPSKEEDMETSRPSTRFAGLAAMTLAVALAALAIGGCGDDDGSGGDAHVNRESGSVNGAIPDNRVGIPPAPTKVADLDKAVKDAGCFLFENRKAEGQGHIPPDAPAPQYKTDPPTSGKHVEPPYQQADGAYRTMPEPQDFVASLDHGRVEIHYAPDLSREIQLELKGLYDTMYGGTLLFPDDVMNWAVAATAWAKFLGCPGYGGVKTLDAIRAFASEMWGKYGGEPVEAFSVVGPTPRDPEEPARAERDEPSRAPEGA